MVKLKLPMMVQDPLVRDFKKVPLLDDVELEDEFFLDGPISKRVAVLDFDEGTGALRGGVRFQPPPAGKKIGGYEIANRDDSGSRDLLAVSVFTTVQKTISLFESSDALGRPLTWAFNAPQLLVVPRAGRDENAYYERESRSLQFFYFPSRQDAEQTVFSCASRDIVAHETGHAVLDGILPDLYNASTPEGLALHESIADLTALLSSFECRELAKAILDGSAGQIDTANAFTEIAEQFGHGRGQEGPLRNINNRKSVDPDDTENFVPADEPHDLSEVISGALFNVMVAVYAQWRKKFEPEKALGIASRQFRRMIYRALDYLPPGEISFADYGRAILAADAAHHPDEASGREALIKEFVQRKIVPKASALSVKTNFKLKALEEVDVQLLCSSDWAAYEFVNQNRKLFGIPEKVHFRVLPRRESWKTHRHRGGEKKEAHECIFKVSWDEKEIQDLGTAFPSQRQITVGATLVIDWDTKIVRALLASEFVPQKKNRDAMLTRLVKEKRLAIDNEGGGRGAPGGAARAEVLGDLMRVRGTARMLHIAR